MPMPIRNTNTGMTDTGSGGNVYSNFSNSLKNITSSIYNTANSSKTISSGSGGYGYGSNYDLLRQISAQNNAFNLQQTDMVNAFNAAEAQKNRDWQERMSRHAHRYEVEDLLAAGLNPVLSAGGQGAYVGSGAAASGQKAVADNTLGNGMISLLSAAMSAASAENVARIYAAASMYGADQGRKNEKDYIDAMVQNNLNTNETNAKNTSLSAYLGIVSGAMNTLGWMLYRNAGKKKSNPMTGFYAG